MTKFYEWTESELGLKINEMDDQHIILIDKMNYLYDCVEKKSPFLEVSNAVSDLANYTIKHFEAEEKYMESIEFEGLPTHKIIHQQLFSQFQSFVDEFKITQVITESFFNFLKVWLTSHIRGIDMKYSHFKHNKKAA